MYVSKKMAEEGLNAYPLVTMGGPQPASLEETLFLPGIIAYSESSSVFGLKDMSAIADHLRIGKDSYTRLHV